MTMNRSVPPIAEPSSANRRLLFLAVAAVLAAVFFFVDHDFRITQYEEFTPWSDAEGTHEAGHNLPKGLALASIGLLGAYLILRRDGRPLRWSGWLLVLGCIYLAWLVASVFWSDDRDMSCRRLATLLFFILGGLGFARHFRPRDLAAMAVVAGVATLAVGIAAELALGAFRPWQADYRFAGTIHPNAQGVLTAVVCLASFCLARGHGARGRPWLWACFAVGLLFLILSRSRSSYGSLLAAMAALWLVGASARRGQWPSWRPASCFARRRWRRPSPATIWPTGSCNAALLGRAEQAGDLTGRVPLWNELLGYAEARPLEGYGYRAFWGDNHIDAVSANVDWTVREAHNAFLETVLSVGLIGGVVLLALVLVSLARAAAGYRASGDPGLAFILGLLVFCLANAFLESGVPSFPTFLAETGLVLLMTMRPRESGQGDLSAAGRGVTR